jgi:hypothetical protein
MADCDDLGYLDSDMAIMVVGSPVLGGDDGHGNAIYRIPLSDEPDPNWIDAFDAGPLMGSLNIPHVDGNEVVITVPKSGSLNDHLRNIDHRIGHANQGGAIAALVPRKRRRAPVHIGDIATGQVVDCAENGKNPAAVELPRLGGAKGGKARARRPSATKRKQSRKPRE